MATADDLLHLVPGRKVIISACEAREHDGNHGCVCDLKGTTQTMGKQYESVFVGTPSWQLEGVDKRVRLSEVTFLKS